MADSKETTDSKVTIKIDADAEGAKRAFADVQRSADAAMESGARSAQKLSQSLDGVAESAKVSARQIKTVAAGMASMAAGVAASAMKANGMDTEASYLGGASRSAVQGASMMAPLGPLAMILGAAGGAGLGALQTYFERDNVGKEQRKGEFKTASDLAHTREEIERVISRTETFEKYLEMLSDTEADAASREKWRADEIAERQREIEEATARMAEAEKGLVENAKTIDGPMTDEQTQAAQKLRDAWSAALKDMQTARAELKALESVKIEKARPNFDTAGTTGERFASLLSGLEKAGIGYAANGTNAIIEKGNNIAAQSLAVLESIDQKTSEAPTAVFA